MSGQLHRTLRLPHATALVVGTIIGSAVFVQAAEVAHHVPNIVGVLLVWIVSGILTLFGALACAELATAFFLLRQRPGYQPAYRVWGYPWAPIVFVLASTAIVINRLVAFPVDSGAGLALVAAGIPVYYLWCRPRQFSESRSTSLPAARD